MTTAHASTHPSPPPAGERVTHGPEQLLQAVASASNILLGTGTLDRIIPEALGMLARGLGVDRAYLFEHHADPQTGAPMATQRYEWCQKGIAPQLDNPAMQSMPYDPLFNDLYKSMLAGKTYGGPVAEMADVQRQFMEAQSIRSMIVVPITLRGALWGFAGFDDCHADRQWTLTDETLLFAMAGCLGTALARSVSEQQLEARDSLLRGVALSTQELLAATDFDSGLPKALATLGEAARVERAYIFENISSRRGSDRRLRARYVWRREHTAPDAPLPTLQDLSYDELFPRWFDILSSGRPISGRVLDFFASVGGSGQPPPLRSILLVPIMSENRFWGIVGFDDCNVTREWAAGDEAILNAMAGGIGGAIARHHAEDALRSSEEHFRSLIENASDIIAILDLTGAIEYLSPSSERALGYRPAELRGHSALDLLHADDARAMLQVREVMATQPEAIRTAEFRLRHRDGSWRVFEGVAKATFDDNVRRYVVNARDITERRKAEQALRHSTDLLRHSQKMEAVGRLAGGEAHDFKNLLTAIMGYGDILLEQLSTGHPMRHEIEEICKAADRAHGLTRQLLAFSRKQILEPKVISLNTVVSDVQKLLARLIGEDIDLVTDLGRELGSVRVDPGQMEQVVINLAVNARDAMPNGGRITLGTANIDLTQRLARGHLSVEPGRYVVLSVSDTGHGMDEDVQSHLFEPFFTTKEVGKGTGLGLSMVYGIIEQSGGHIMFDSTPGVGTTFTLYFPRMDLAAQKASTGTDRTSTGGSETILLVEDEDMVRDLTTRVLRERGYTVLAARSGSEALRIMDEKSNCICMLLTDIVMPQMGGQALAQQLQARCPNLRVLYMSGYAQESFATLDALSLERNYIQKPFTPATLARKVRDVLDAT